MHTFCHNDGRDYFICMDGNCFRTEVIKATWKSLSVPDIELQGPQEVVGMLEERKALVLGWGRCFLLQLIRKRTLSVIMTEGIFSFVWMATVVDDTKVQTILVYDTCWNCLLALLIGFHWDICGLWGIISKTEISLFR